MSPFDISASRSVTMLGRSNPLDLLRATKALIEERGWIRSPCADMYVFGEQLTVPDAIVAATGWEDPHAERSPISYESGARRREAALIHYHGHMMHNKQARRVYVATMAYLAQACGRDDVFSWNDDYCVDHFEALDVLDRAIELASAAEGPLTA